jgi:hypothetical protein
MKSVFESDNQGALFAFVEEKLHDFDSYLYAEPVRKKWLAGCLLRFRLIFHPKLLLWSMRNLQKKNVL